MSLAFLLICDSALAQKPPPQKAAGATLTIDPASLFVDIPAWGYHVFDVQWLATSASR